MDKITKKSVIEYLLAGAKGEDYAVEIPTEAVIEVLEKELASMAKKAENAKARAAEKRAAGDQLQNDIRAILSDTPKTAQEIADELGGEFSAAMVIARVKNLVANEEAAKETHKEGNRQVTRYTASM